MSQDPPKLWTNVDGADAEDAVSLADAGWWLTGSASLLLWTAIALLLTAA